MLPAVFNTHIHLPPNFSAFESVEDALDQAKGEGCALLGASNYYDFSVYESFVEGAQARGIDPTCGIEVLCKDEEAASKSVRYNDPANPGKVYICGKGLTRWKEQTPRAKELMAQIRAADENRMARMAEKLQEAFAEQGLRGPSAEVIIQAVAVKYRVPAQTVVLQERHLAQAYQTAFGEQVPEEKRNEVFARINGAVGTTALPDIRAHLMKAGKRAFVEESFVSLDEGLELIRELGGIAAYPVVADGMNPMSEMERDLPTLIGRLRELGIGFAEFISNRNSPQALNEYVLALWLEGFPVTCGTEHNTPERIPIQPQCKDGSPIPDFVQEVFWRSALKIKEHEEHA